MNEGWAERARTHVALLVILGASTAICGCGGATVFKGRENIAIVGVPPAPPPPEPPKRVQVTDKAIVITEKIQFDVNKATIKEVSHSLLNEVVDVIKKNPRLKKLAIEGHASSDGIAAQNLKLSDDRSKSVMKYLVDHGVEAARLQAKGYGDTRPIADNKTEDGREKNRRVEFNILEQDQKNP